MSLYRCRYLDRAFDVFQIQGVACENDAEAIEMARPSPSWAARHPGRARSRRALRPRSMIQRGLPRKWFPYGRSVRPAIAQTRWHRYSHSCVIARVLSLKDAGVPSFLIE
jgi:hypothetical protein